MATTVTTIDKGDFICWATQEDSESYIVWDVGVAQETCKPKTDWTKIKFKKLGETDYRVEEIVMTPISYLDFCGDNAIALKIEKQQGTKCWCIRFKSVD